MRAYFVDGRGTTERDLAVASFPPIYQEPLPTERRDLVAPGGEHGGRVTSYRWRTFTLRRFLRPIFRSEAARLADERPLMQEEIAAYVEDGVDPDRALANLIAHIGPYRYAEAK